MFRENNIDYHRVNYFIDPISEGKLRELLNKAGLNPYEVLRVKEAEAKDLGLSPESPPDAVIDAIVRHPNLLQRPIVEFGEKAVLARPAEKALELIRSAKDAAGR